MGGINTLRIAHDFLSRKVPEGGFCIDATAGRGNDTAFLCSLVGEKGRVLAFDTGHWVMVAASEAFNDAVVDWLAATDTAR